MRKTFWSLVGILLLSAFMGVQGQRPWSAPRRSHTQSAPPVAKRIDFNQHFKLDSGLVSVGLAREIVCEVGRPRSVLWVTKDELDTSSIALNPGESVTIIARCGDLRPFWISNHPRMK